MAKTKKSAKQTKRRTRHERANESHDELLDAALERYGNIVMMYDMFQYKRPIMLFDIQEQRIYAYRYQEFRNEMNERSQRILKQQYEQAQVDRKIVLFVRDNVRRKLCVVLPMWIPALASLSAIFNFPSVGQSSLMCWTA